ncbi:MAG: ABC transporter permease [Bryobacteraceae bacterium]|nr:ABC transporter permease [Bryobacteraceae bacterium]
MNTLWRKLAYLLSRRRRELELEDEIAFHREMMVRDSRPAAAFGASPLRLREESRDAWGWTWLDQLAQDLRFGFRQLIRNPGFTIAATLILSLGLGVNLAAFRVFDLAFLKPLPIRTPERFQRFDRHSPEASATSMSCAAVRFYAAHNTALASVMGVAGGRLTLGDRKSAAVEAHFVTGNYLADLGVRPALGRILTVEDDRRAAAPVAVLSHAFWSSRLAQNPAVPGSVIQLNGKPVTVAGVLPYDFHTGRNIDVWLPMERHADLFPGSDLLTSFEKNECQMFGMLRADQTPAGAREALRPMVAALGRLEPKAVWKAEHLEPRPAGSPGHLDDADTLSAVLGMTGLVLLILLSCCANLGNMLLARGAAREREWDVRMAVGAGKARIVRQLLTESLLLGLIGVTAGLVASHWAGVLILRTQAAPADGLALNWRVAAIAAVLTLLSVLAFGLAPAFAAVRGGLRGTRARRILIAAQVAVGCVLVILSALLDRGVRALSGAGQGFDAAHVVIIDPELQARGLNGAAARQRLQEMKTRLQSVPGVVEVAATLLIPLGDRLSVAHLRNPPIALVTNSADPAYFAAMGIPLTRGRLYGDRERDAAILSESTARRLFPEGEALGRVIEGFGKRTVVGIVADTQAWKSHDAGYGEAYTPIDEGLAGMMLLAVRTEGDPADRIADFRGAAESGGVTPSVQLLRNLAAERAGRARSTAAMAALLGVAALALAAVGIFGLVAYTVAQRSREIGIRLALGARSGDVLRVVLEQYRAPLLVGAASGILTALGLSQVLRSALNGLSPWDWPSHAAGLAVFFATAVAAALWPARRALRVDPAVSLRWD